MMDFAPVKPKKYVSYVICIIIPVIPLHRRLFVLNKTQLLSESSIMMLTKSVVMTISGLNSTDKTPMYEMPLIYVIGVMGLRRAFFVLGFWAMAFCPGISGPWSNDSSLCTIFGNYQSHWL